MLIEIRKDAWGRWRLLRDGTDRGPVAPPSPHPRAITAHGAAMAFLAWLRAEGYTGQRWAIHMKEEYACFAALDGHVPVDADTLLAALAAMPGVDKARPRLNAADLLHRLVRRASGGQVKAMLYTIHPLAEGAVVRPGVATAGQRPPAKAALAERLAA